MYVHTLTYDAGAYTRFGHNGGRFGQIGGLVCRSFISDLLGLFCYLFWPAVKLTFFGHFGVGHDGGTPFRTTPVTTVVKLYQMHIC